MAKKKTKSAIPKKIAGVKVPRSVRKGRFGELLASRSGQAVIAQAILGAGAVAAGFKAKDAPGVRRAAHDAKAGAGHAVQSVEAGGAQLAYALGEAARTFAEALRRGEPRSFSGGATDEASAWIPSEGPKADEKARPKPATAPEAGAG